MWSGLKLRFERPFINLAAFKRPVDALHLALSAFNEARG